MEREEFKTLVKAMKAVYAQPTFIPDQDAFNVWYGLLKDLSYKQVNIAVQKHMLTERFPPTIADLREKSNEVIEKQLEEMSELEAWSLVRKAIGNSGYHSEEEFQKLPEACKIAVGTASNLREWALMDSDQVETVEQSHFIRNYRTAVKRLSEEKKIPESLRKLIAAEREKHSLIERRKQAEIEEEKPEIPEIHKEEKETRMSEETRRKLDEFLGRR